MNPSSPVPILQVGPLRVAYPGEVALVTDWSASIGAGVTQLHGDTGSGKSTLLRVLAGVLPAQGRLVLRGVRLEADAAAYRREVFLFDPAADADDQITARALTAALHAGDARADARAWQQLVDGFALAEHLDKPMYMLSTGSKRKVGLAAALASGRALILLDEPTGGLDAASVRCLWSALAGAAARPDRAVVVASAERIERVPLAASIELPLG